MGRKRRENPRRTINQKNNNYGEGKHSNIKHYYQFGFRLQNILTLYNIFIFTIILWGSRKRKKEKIKGVWRRKKIEKKGGKRWEQGDKEGEERSREGKSSKRKVIESSPASGWVTCAVYTGPQCSEGLIVSKRLWCLPIDNLNHSWTRSPAF